MDTRKASPPSPAPAASARIRKLNRKEPVEGDFVLYWMQQSQRAEGNDALEYAIRKANLMDIPVVVAFGLTANYPEANLRHYVFMLEGLREVGRKLRARNIRFVVQHGQPPDVALRLGRHATAIVCDRGYLTHQKEWRAEVARRAKCAVEEVECDAIVPVGLVSEKREAAARTFRPRVSKLAGSFLRRLPAARPAVPSADFPLGSLDLNDEGSVLERLSIDTSVKPVPHFTGGTDEAKKRLAEFIRRRLTGYGENRGRPETDNVSQMSPYLHFGQVSPVYIARKISEQEAKAPDDCRQYLDELIVSRELSFHFVHHTPDYDRFSSIPEWARATLKKHANDKRGYLYGRNELEAGKTHDPYWNAAMEEMKATGYMHNHMRMYWGKQILAWSAAPEEAFATALALNNKYFLDGRDPNSYANIGWIFGLHDRPWPERPVFGTVRSMTAGGLERKTRPDEYVKKVARLTELSD